MLDVRSSRALCRSVQAGNHMGAATTRACSGGAHPPERVAISMLSMLSLELAMSLLRLSPMPPCPRRPPACAHSHVLLSPANTLMIDEWVWGLPRARRCGATTHA